MDGADEAAAHRVAQAIGGIGRRLENRLGYRAGIPTYAVAAYVAMSRLHDNVHKASDVVFGATIGTIVGRSVTWHGRNFYASPMLLPKGGGIIVNVHAAAPLSHSRR